MTTIRNKKALRKLIDHAPDDRLRHCEGEIDEYMAGKEPSVEAVRLLLKGALILLVLFAIYSAPDLIAWASGDAPVMTGRMK